MNTLPLLKFLSILITMNPDRLVWRHDCHQMAFLLLLLTYCSYCYVLLLLIIWRLLYLGLSCCYCKGVFFVAIDVFFYILLPFPKQCEKVVPNLECNQLLVLYITLLTLKCILPVSDHCVWVPICNNSEERDNTVHGLQQSICLIFIKYLFLKMGLALIDSLHYSNQIKNWWLSLPS